MKNGLENLERNKMKIPSFYQIKQNSGIYLNRLAKLNWFVKLTSIIIIWPIALIPIFIYILVRMLLVPVGFWQEFALIAGWCIVLGWLQVILGIFVVFITLAIIYDIK